MNAHTGIERLDVYEQRMADLRTRALASPVGNPGWCLDFERFAERLAAEHQARTGYPLPSNQGFSATAGRAAK